MKNVCEISWWRMTLCTGCWVFWLVGGCAAPASSAKTVPKDYEVVTKRSVSKTGTSGEFKLVWSDTIKSSYTAKVGEAFVVVERLKKANEGAARVNIREGTKRLSALSL